MLKYVLKRVLIFIPTLFAVSLVTFIIGAYAPGDPVANLLSSNNGGQGQAASRAAGEKDYIELRRELGLDLPLFYFTISNSTVSDTLYKISRKNHREALERLSFEYGIWDNVAKYYEVTKKFETELYNIKKTKKNAKSLREAKSAVYTLLETYDEQKIKTLYSNLQFLFDKTPSLSEVESYLNASFNAFHHVIDNKNTFGRYVPKINWYGAHNQYHNWIFGDVPWFGEKEPGVYYRSEGFLRGDFGQSYQDRRPVGSVIWDAIWWTFMFSLISIFITYLLAIPIGVRAAVKKGSRGERITSTILFMLYSTPTFWVGTMLIVFLCNPDYLNWFPSSVSMMRTPEDAPFFQRFIDTAYHSILPLFCWTYGSLAYISRQMRGGMLSVLGQDYIRTAYAKGLEPKKVIWKHAFRNSLLPVITLFASVFPLAISGSIVIEVIFTIPGMGKVIIDALHANNYPVIYTVVMFAAVLTLVGSLVADILYAVVDPRISYSKK